MNGYMVITKMNDLIRENTVKRRDLFFCWESGNCEKIRCLFTAYCIVNELDEKQIQCLLDQIYETWKLNIEKESFEVFMRKFL